MMLIRFSKDSGNAFKASSITHYEAEPAPIVTVDDFDDHSVIIKNVNGIYTVEADWLLQVMKGINFDDYESLNYFQKVLINGGVIDALEKRLFGRRHGFNL